MAIFSTVPQEKLSQLHDEGLIQLVVGKDASALGALYDRYGRLIYSLVYRIVNDAASAEEVTQDVFYQLWQKAWMYRPEQGKLSTWLTRIARNRAIDIYRRRKSQVEVAESTWEEEDPHEPADDLVVEDVIEMNIQARTLRKAMASLPFEQKVVLSLAFFQGMSHQEISEYSGEPLGTVKTRIRLAMQKLRSFLTEPSP